jgi:adenosylcobinamide-GDP ribazoletransferase
VKSFLAAIAFLTRFPVGGSGFDAADVGHSAGWFPLVGILLGGVYCGTAAVLKAHLPLGVIAVVLVLLDALATGALHYDGLADSADGLGGGKDREDILRIMRDHAIGSYGGVALVIAAALKIATYDALLSHASLGQVSLGHASLGHPPIDDWIRALILTPALGRWSILLLTGTLPYARQDASVVEGMGTRALVFGTLSMVVALGATMSGRAWIAAAVVVAVTAGFGQYCRRRIGGITGDTLGASVQLSECAALLTFLWVGTR